MGAWIFPRPKSQAYHALEPDSECPQDDSELKQHPSEHTRSRTSGRSKDVLLALLLLTNIFLLLVVLRGSRGEVLPSNLALIDPLPTTYKNFWWWTKYSSKNWTESDALWDAILPSHGFIAMDEDWVAEQHWPESMRLPSNDKKRVYLLESYHQLHCITIIRKTFWELSRGEETTYPVTHAGHCFDTLRQYIQCNADNTPLYLFGDDTAGNGQLHQCRDWDALRDFATKNTACYRDSVTPIMLGSHFGFCDDGDDGVIWAEETNVTHSDTAWG